MNSPLLLDYKKTDLHKPDASSANSGKSQTVIKIDPTCRLIPQLVADDFLDIQGVYEVHTNATHKTFRIIFDGTKETVGRLAEYLCSCKKSPRCGAENPCGTVKAQQAGNHYISMDY